MDMTGRLCRVLIAARFNGPRPDQLVFRALVVLAVSRVQAERCQRPVLGPRVEVEVSSTPSSGVPVLGPKEAGSSDSVYWPLPAR